MAVCWAEKTLPGDPSVPIRPPQQCCALQGPLVLLVMAGEMQRGTSSMSWWMANPFLGGLGYLTYKPGITPALAETTTCRPLLSSLWINSKQEKNSLG